MLGTHTHIQAGGRSVRRGLRTYKSRSARRWESTHQLAREKEADLLRTGRTHTRAHTSLLSRPDADHQICSGRGAHTHTFPWPEADLLRLGRAHNLATSRKEMKDLFGTKHREEGEREGGDDDDDDWDVNDGQARER